ncbi:uncharacterized protein LOC142235640 [Haematobia irritans]|uniref:uncharacterized protein LOC142235640 n=1 Tax=Haematobia irritans TaxID=7368 RepID=UPI003F4F488D
MCKDDVKTEEYTEKDYIAEISRSKTSRVAIFGKLRSAIKKCIRNCKICLIYKQKAQNQIMAALPTERSTFSLPFSYTGIDFAWHFSIKTATTRQAPYQKGYGCVFVCFSTKAIHLELCSNLSSDSFLAAFTCFVRRRGLPQKIMSDNGTNFVGAERSLRYEFSQFIKVAANDISAKYTPHGFQWSFIPPNAPHMGGHFLRGAALVAFPEVTPDNLSLTDRWERLKVQQHQFARLRKDEYLKELQKRYKWHTPKANLSIGQLVVVKDDQLPPCEWRLGRITKTHQSNDGRVRIVDILTTKGTITRDITKLCPLFSESQLRS